MFGLTSQLRRASVSITSNISEGLGRNHKKETIQFMYIARGSIYEVETLLNIAVMNELITENIFEEILPKIDESVKLLNGFIKYLSKSVS